MSFLDHLEELRWHILRSSIAILVFAIGAFVAMPWIFENIVIAPIKPEFLTYRVLCKIFTFTGQADMCIDKIDVQLQSRTLGGQFMMHITASFVMGLVIAFPYVFWEIWRFVAPGLYQNEKKISTGAVFYVSILFLIGILFGYFIVSPMSIQFLANYTLSEKIERIIDISDYLGTLVTLTLSCGFVFQLPMLVYVLSKMGMVTPLFLQTYRKHAIVIILIISAIITPSPDILTQMLVAVPIFMLYEVSIWIAAYQFKKRMKKLENL